MPRRVLIVCLDVFLAALALVAAILLRFDFKVPGQFWKALPVLIAVLVLARLVANFLFRLHTWSFRFSGLVDGARVWMAALMGTGLFLAAIYLGQLQGPPRSVLLMELLLTGFCMTLVRFSPRLASTYLADNLRSRNKESSRTLILGAGAAGDLLLRDLQRSEDHSYNIVGFLDDDKNKHGLILGGKSVLGALDDLPAIAKKYDVEHALIAVPRLEARRLREVLAMCADLKLQFKILPLSFVYLKGRVSASMLQALSPDDLLPREVITLSDHGEAPKSAGRIALVTGAAGSIGSEICRQLLVGQASRLVMADINENELYLLLRRLEHDFKGAPISAEIVDIRDEGRINALFSAVKPQDVFHAAAHKHVPLMEWAPCEAVKNNVMGTANVARAADACGAERFVYISTDKAVNPTSVMGVSKRVGEKIVRRMAKRSKTKFRAVRFGNVLGSAGSVVPIFREQIARGGPVTVTDPEVKRYFMTIQEAVGLVLKAGYADYGELCVLDMGEQIRIQDLARHMITMTGQVPDVDVKIVYTGLRPGEKLFEELLTEEEERTQEAVRKIFVAQCPPVSDDLEEKVAALSSAANAEDRERVLAIFKEMVPSFKNNGGMAKANA